MLEPFAAARSSGVALSASSVSKHPHAGQCVARGSVWRHNPARAWLAKAKRSDEFTTRLSSRHTEGRVERIANWAPKAASYRGSTDRYQG